MKDIKKSFKDVTMVFDDYVLKSGDLLVSPEQDGTYYLAKKEGNKYRLQDGQVAKILLQRAANGQKNKHIKLNVRTQYGNPPSTILLETCTFEKVDTNDVDGKIKMTCDLRKTRRWAEEPFITTTLSKENFQEFFGKAK